MRYRNLGASNLRLSEIGFGTIPIMRGPKAILPLYYNLDGTSSSKLLLEAYGHGINFFDTAIVPEYGDAEEKLGQAFAKSRDRVVFSSKARAFTKHSMQSAIEASLRNMKTDYLDIYSIHQLKPDAADIALDEEKGALGALIEAQKAGKIREIGVGTHYATIAARAANDPRIVVVQLPYNIIETGIYETAKELSPAIQEKAVFNKVLAGGALTSHVPLSCLLATALAESPVSALVGIGTKYQLDSLINSCRDRLDVDYSHYIRSLGQATLCNRCQKCVCPQGVDIHHILRYRTYAFLGFQFWASHQWAERKAKSIQCPVGCCECLATCPRTLDIPQLILEAVTMLGDN